MGLDPQADRDKVHEIVGVQLQESSFPAKLRVGEILDMYQSFYREPADVTELIEVLGLESKRKDYYRSLSGGQRQRLSVVLALIGQPKIAVLDEMTTGLGPQARRDTWDLIERVRDRGGEDRAGDALHGGGRTALRPRRPHRLRARRRSGHPGGPRRASLRGKQVRFLPSGRFDDGLLTALPEVTALHRDGHHVVVTGTGELANAVIIALFTIGVTALDVQLDASTLEDAFVRLTGKHLHEEGEQS